MYNYLDIEKRLSINALPIRTNNFALPNQDLNQLLAFFLVHL